MSDYLKSRSGLYRTTLDSSRQRAAFTNGEIPVAVYGLGKMGLPIATVFAGVTGNVVGVDIDPEVVEDIMAGDCPVSGEPGLGTAMETVVRNGSLRATSNPVEAAKDAGIHVIIVPTLMDTDEEPDLTAVESVVESIGAGLDPGDIVLVESTVPPGTCREYIQPGLVSTSGLDPDDFGLAFCPERSASGQALRDIRESYPKVIGGRDDESTRVATLVYNEITNNEIIPVMDPITAECAKVFEGVYRDVNIALANELAGLVEDLTVDVREAIAAANTQPYCDIHEPGPGVGGHCIPYYPYFLTSGQTALPLVTESRKINESMPTRTVALLATILEQDEKDLRDASVLLCGVTYRPGIDETRESPAYPIATELSTLGAEVYAVDPVCTDPGGIDATMTELRSLSSLDLDAIVLVTGHEEFRELPWEVYDDAIVLDGRGFFEDDIPLPVYTLGSGWKTKSGISNSI